MCVMITCKYEKDTIKNNQIITLYVAMKTSGRIWPNFELIQAFMHVLITYNYEKDQMKKSGENVMTSFSPLMFLRRSRAATPWSMVGSRRISNSFKLSCISSLPASMK